MHAAERRYHFINDRRKRYAESRTPPNHDIIMTLMGVKRAREPHRLTQAPADPVTLDGAAFLLGHGKADPRLVIPRRHGFQRARLAALAAARLQSQRRGICPAAIADKQKVPALEQSLHRKMLGLSGAMTGCHRASRFASGGQALAAVGAAGSQNLAAALGAEAGAEAVATLADKPGGLISTFHGSFSAVVASAHTNSVRGRSS
jgi:hypothetical protein